MGTNVLLRQAERGGVDQRSQSSTATKFQGLLTHSLSPDSGKMFSWALSGDGCSCGRPLVHYWPFQRVRLVRLVGVTPAGAALFVGRPGVLTFAMLANVAVWFAAIYLAGPTEG